MKRINIPYSPSRFDASEYLKNNLKHLMINNKHVIDIGCGRYFALSLLENISNDFHYTGIDINLIKHIDKKNKKRKFISADITKYKDKNKYDLALCLWVLEHIQQDSLALKNIHKLLSKNGYLLLVVPSCWTWPIEFGRHGYHYYSLTGIHSRIRESKFKIVNYYNSSGFFGLVFMIIYSWPRYILLIISLPMFYFTHTFGISKESWKEYSSKLVRNTFYSYHNKPNLVAIHNHLVKRIVNLDKKLKLFPLSYVFVLKKE